MCWHWPQTIWEVDSSSAGWSQNADEEFVEAKENREELSSHSYLLTRSITMAQNKPQHDSVSYWANLWGNATKKYQRDRKKREKNGWTLVSCTEAGRDIFSRVVLTAIYEK
jgi:hypothetical protein